MWSERIVMAGMLVLGAAYVTWNHWRQDEPIIRTMEQLEQREDRALVDTLTGSLFSGTLVDSSESGTTLSKIEIRDGKAHGKSQGWHESGRLEVEEFFVHGISQGKRQRWHENGQKRSEAMMVEGKIEGLFKQWHENGQLAAEVEMVAGEAHGLSQAWHPSGELKARVQLAGGEIVHSDYHESD